MLVFQGCTCNVGGGMDSDTGVFSVPLGGTYLFVFHIATHDNKKALLSIRWEILSSEFWSKIFLVPSFALQTKPIVNNNLVQ